MQQDLRVFLAKQVALVPLDHLDPLEEQEQQVQLVQQEQQEELEQLVQQEQLELLDQRETLELQVMHKGFICYIIILFSWNTILVLTLVLRDTLTEGNIHKIPPEDYNIT